MGIKMPRYSMRRLAVALVVLALGLAAVGVALGSGGTTLGLIADPGGAPTFNKKTLTAKAGKVTIVMSYHCNLTKYGCLQIPHNIAIKGHGVNVKGPVIPTGTSTVSVSLKKGTYEFYCSFGDHEAYGMKGTLIVK